MVKVGFLLKVMQLIRLLRRKSEDHITTLSRLTLHISCTHDRELSARLPELLGLFPEITFLALEAFISPFLFLSLGQFPL